ncbi:hypothetical protein XAR_2017 [Xanthomonas citri pv. glycines str. 8ra]|nr:hypothetical protein XAR_2017 [Xanthomonas citri pv. glycines str. 8ra]
MKYLLSAALCVAALSACTDREAQRQAQATAQAQAKETQAEALAKQYDEAVKAQNWDMARAHGAALIEGYAGTAAATRIEPGYADIKAKGEQARELRRMQALWQYSQVPAKGGT